MKQECRIDAMTISPAAENFPQAIVRSEINDRKQVFFSISIDGIVF